MSARRAAWVLCPLLLSLALAGCKDEETKTKPEAEAGADAKADAKTEAGASDPNAGEDPAQAPAAASGELDQLLAWLPPDPIAVAFDRVGQRLDPAIVAVVYGIPPMAADLLVERATLDEALDVVFDGDAEPENWLASDSLAFGVALSKTPYFVRPLTKPAAELAPLFEQGGFSKNTVDEIEVWLPSGSFPWRIALVGDGVAAFIPVDVPGAGLEPLTSARDQDGTAVETELSRTLTDDPMIELVLFSAGPLIHYDVKQTIAQVQFALRRVQGPGAQVGYEGQIRLEPSGDVDECTNELRERAHPEENQQVQKLVSSVEFVVEGGGVVGRLAITPEQVKHFIIR
ncbi:hypothetical protein ENSA5_69310 [Enhygromyxa salina]|uniref:Lipoprotein n=1 Tax=Enhygromyxa salina TaxID=215803 RepID=A0A2S9XAW0_9BACT|nr:hypothetical protein [Enhygromyxa salina]PRP89988.1 hypothetical protein ENSA5_69310 [Enhygromyxa salina]